MDDIALLKHDHEEFKKIMEKLDKTTERGVKTREELFAKLKTELTVHETIEEEIFYPASRSTPRPRRSCSGGTRSTTWST